MGRSDHPMPHRSSGLIAGLPLPVLQSPTASVRINSLTEPTVLGSRRTRSAPSQSHVTPRPVAPRPYLGVAVHKRTGWQGRSTLENPPSPWKITRCEGAR